MDAEGLLLTWEMYEQRVLWTAELEEAQVMGDGPRAEAAKLALDQLRPVGAVEALRANGQLVRLALARRWQVVLDARAQGVSWQAIGQALGMPAHQVWNECRAAVEQQNSAGRLDADGARAVLTDRYTLQADGEHWTLTGPGSAGGDGSVRWRVGPAGVSAQTAQRLAEQVLWESGLGVVTEWTGSGQEPQPRTAVVTPGPTMP